MEKIILASASPRRKELLEQIGIAFLCHPACGEEKITHSVPEEIVKELASQKAEEVAVQYPDSVVLGADTIVSCDGDILGKPASRQEATEMINKLQGRTHEVYTGVCLVKMSQGQPVKKTVFAVETKVEMFPMSSQEVETYIASGEGDDKAGAYGIQGKCAAYIKGITGDYYNVVGLPVSRVYQELKAIMEE